MYRILLPVYGRAFYQYVADAVTGFLPPSMRDFDWYWTSHNLKLWYGSDTTEHYEVQIIKRGKKIGLEIGFHAEHKDRSRNEQTMERLVSQEKKWRAKLGKGPEVGPFIGYQSGTWRRVSEVWDDASDEPEAAIEAAERLATYITTLEPIRTT